MISVKLEKTNNQYMLIHGYTGAVDIVDRCVVDYLQSVGRERIDASLVSSDTINTLVNRGYLTEKTKEQASCVYNNGYIGRLYCKGTNFFYLF